MLHELFTDSQDFVADCRFIWNTVGDIGKRQETLGVHLVVWPNDKRVAECSSVWPVHSLAVDFPSIGNRDRKQPVRAQIKFSRATNKSGKNDAANGKIDSHVMSLIVIQCGVSRIACAVESDVPPGGNMVRRPP